MGFLNVHHYYIFSLPLVVYYPIIDGLKALGAYMIPSAGQLKVLL